MTPLVSVITVSFNSLAGLRATDESLRRCSARGWETLLLDGLSTDGTQGFMQSSDCHYTVRVSERDTGIYDAMNKGIKLARGKYLLFMNCGDRLHEELDLEALEERLKAGKAIVIGHCLTDAGHLVRVNADAFHTWTFARMAFPHQASFIPKAEFERLGPYDTRLRLAADQEWFLRAMRRGADFSSLGQTAARYEGGGLSEAPAHRALVQRERRSLLVRHLGWPWYFWMLFVRGLELDEWFYKVRSKMRSFF